MRLSKMKDYIGKLKELYPDEDEKTLKEIVRFGCFKMTDSLIEKNEVRIESRLQRMTFLVYQKRSLRTHAKKD